MKMNKKRNNVLQQYVGDNIKNDLGSFFFCALIKIT